MDSVVARHELRVAAMRGAHDLAHDARASPQTLEDRMTSTQEQLDCQAALDRLQRALDGKPRKDDVTFDLPPWMADIFSGKGVRNTKEN